MKNPLAPPVSIAYYTKQSYKLLLERAEDRENLDDNYKDWLTKVKELQADFRRQGIKANLYEVDMEELRMWCLHKSLPNIQSSRSQFVSEMMNRRPS
ncbi:hypothetical protein FVR03_20925 [Pontibacter qinzhouensis]|uniref:Uncharacterized protein n=1 Tax=Pontibacter qinzhouensis TaxID=2603253 RepID=A0A5C8J2A4_9BACT|nr:hypothetical protein [Pontibacter qinzhouensis]TXK28254.1 hypothetical protein FVR03_20925 [Pontibacter qinzhouensis]